jgi:methylated-DNA-[protein]-cysteine S-methyltransferase
MRLHRAIVPTPLGDMLALSSEAGLCALEFTDVDGWRGRRARGEARDRGTPTRDRMTRLERRLATWFPPHEIVDQESDMIGRARQWLGDYFSGVPAPVDLPLDMRGAAFEKRVWSALLAIPPGTTTSYGAIAKRLGAPAASRAVGLANGANPIAIIVPCHRVIGSGGSLVGYGGGLDRKTWLIDHERRWRTGTLF